MKNLFIDTDIILDLLTKRQPFYEFSAELFSLADQKMITINVSSLSFSNLNYILSKHFTAIRARKLLLKFKTLVNVLSVDDKITSLALTSDFADFEDGMQYYTALENNIRVLITRNLKDYKMAEINVMPAKSYLKISKLWEFIKISKCGSIRL